MSGLDKFFKIERRGWLIVRPKAIKSREDIFCYLSSYLCSPKSLSFCSFPAFHHHYYPMSLISPQVIKSSSHQVLKPLHKASRYWVVIAIVTKQICAKPTLVLSEFLVDIDDRYIPSSRLTTSLIVDKSIIC